MKASQEQKRVTTGEAAIATGSQVLTTGRIDSCVVICLWDHKVRIGAMAHIAFPSYPGVGSRVWFGSGVSPEVAFPFMISSLKRNGASLENISVRMVCSGNGLHSGAKIMALTKSITETLQIPIARGSVEGLLGKSAAFDVRSGVISVRHANGKVERV